GLLLLEWLAGAGAAWWLSSQPAVGSPLLAMAQDQAGTFLPEHWIFWAALALGGLALGVPLALTLARPGAAPTRHAVAAGQMLWAALLLQLTGGRAEIHVYALAALGLLASYWDWRVLVTAAAVLLLDHGGRALYWP